MLKISFEFRKGIFFIRLIGNLNKETSQIEIQALEELIVANKFKYIVLNTNHLKEIDLTGLNYLTKIYYLTKENEGNLVICDKFNILKTFLNDNVLSVKDELEVL